MSPSMPCKSSKAVVPKLEASAKLDVEANRHAATGLAIGATASCPWAPAALDRTCWKYSVTRS